MVCVYVQMLILVNAMAMDMIYEYWYHVRQWIVVTVWHMWKYWKRQRYEVLMYWKHIGTYILLHTLTYWKNIGYMNIVTCNTWCMRPKRDGKLACYPGTCTWYMWVDQVLGRLILSEHLCDSTLLYWYMWYEKVGGPSAWQVNPVGAPLRFHSTAAGQQYLTYGSIGYMSTGAVLGYA